MIKSTIWKESSDIIKNPYQGRGSDIIAKMKNRNGETVLLQRGEAIMGVVALNEIMGYIRQYTSITLRGNRQK